MFITAYSKDLASMPFIQRIVLNLHAFRQTKIDLTNVYFIKLVDHPTKGKSGIYTVLV